MIRKNAQKFIHANFSSSAKPQQVTKVDETPKKIGMLAKLLFTLSNYSGTLFYTIPDGPNKIIARTNRVTLL